MYATKKRKRIMKQLKSTLTGVQEVSKSNPSKRHRERLNSELDHLANLLPYEQGIISKLDKLSVLRLAVNYLRTKSYFQAAIYDKSLQDHHHHHHMFARSSYNRPIGNQEAPGKVKGGEVTTTTSDPTCIARAEDILQALNGFLLVVTCDGEVFFASETVEQYLGFHQSDIIHQSIMELIHSEDREQFKLQLFARPTLNLAEMTSDHVNAFNQQFRRFTVRFRCLLDNTSGFITLEITGRLRVLHGQNLKSSSSKTLALFALCSPLGVLPSSEVQGHEMTFKSKHKMDLSPITMDPRGKAIFGYTERELSEKKGYDLIHYDDSAYYAAAHQELIKTGSSGLIAYRLLSKDQRWIWLQTSSKVVYKNSKPDCINCVHRQLTSDEGNDLLGKRGSEFKLPYALIYDLGRPCGEAPRLTNENPSNHQKFSFRSNLPDVTEPDSAKGDPISTSGGPIVFEDASGKRTNKSSNQCSSTFNERKVISEAHSLIGKGNARSKPSRTQKKVREHLKEYLQAGRRRKTPYREIAKSYSRQEDSSKPKPSNKSAVGLVSEGQVLNDCRSAIEKINFRKDFEQGVYEQLAGSFCEATCGLPERTQPVHDDSFDFNRSSLQNDELLYYGQSHYYNYYYNYQRYQNNCPTVKDLSEDLTTFCDYQNTLTDCSRYPQIQPSLNDSLLVREMPQVSTTVPIAGYLDSSGESSNKVHSAYVANFQNSRFPHHLNHQSVDNWKRGSSEFVQDQTRPDEKNVDQTTFHSSNNYVNKSFPRNSNHHIRHHDQYAVDLARQLSSRQSLFPIGQDSGSSVFSLEISETSLQVDTLTNFISMTSVHQNQLQERISPEGEPRPAKEPSNLPFGSFHWYPGFDRSTFNSSSSQHDDNNNNSNNNINNKAAYNHDVNESVGNYQTQVSHHLHRRGQNYTSLLNSPGLEQRDLNMEFTEVSSNSDPNYDQNCHQRIGQGRTTTDSLHQQQCSDDYLLSLTSPSHESKTLRVLGCAIQTSKEQDGSYGKGRLTVTGYNGQEKDSLAGGFSSIGPNYSLTNGSYNTSLAGIKTHESGLYETVRNQDAGLKVYQISDIGSASVLHNHRSVIRLNGRCSQPQQVQAVPVIRAPSIGGNFEL